MNEDSEPLTEREKPAATSILSRAGTRHRKFCQSCAVDYLITAAITHRPAVCPQICNQRGVGLGTRRPSLGSQLNQRGPKKLIHYSKQSA